jgi:O-acetyl-ADP-ribose deacetylase (regulator of RNase III)
MVAAEEETQLASAYRNSIRLAGEHNLRTVAFPNISTGIYGFPRERAVDIAIAAVREALPKSPSIEQVTFVCFDDENYRLYRERLSCGDRTGSYGTRAAHCGSAGSRAPAVRG